MTRDAYIRMTGAMQKLTDRLPLGTALFRLPTYLCAVCYLASLLMLMLMRDLRLIRVLLTPAACFLIVTALRPVINRQRPYDRFGAAPVGNYRPGKGKSMPSRHAASAAAIAIAVVYAFPSFAVGASMALLCLIIAALRVLCGQHYPSDVLAAIALSIVVSAIGYAI